jgi:hypothetical protein
MVKHFNGVVKYLLSHVIYRTFLPTFPKMPPGRGAHQLLFETLCRMALFMMF